MTNIEIKTERLQHLKESVLASVYEACEYEFLFRNNPEGICDIMHNLEPVGAVEYRVDFKNGYYILKNIEVLPMLTLGNMPMPNLTKALNEALKNQIDKKLNLLN